jgi:NAD(P)H-dependent flavin oxidoreductase YrpB (nitropropane dioxygenase family)
MSANQTTYRSILTPACADICKQYKSPLTGKPALLVTGGGVNDGRSLASALMLGASGVWVGTRFIPCKESKYPEIGKRQLVAKSLEAVACSILTQEPGLWKQTMTPGLGA